MDMIVTGIGEPFSYAFMRTALLTTLVVAVPMAMLSCILVLRGWSLMGDAISHAVLPGVVLAWLAGLPIALGAFCAAMITALSAGYLQANSRIKPDTALGIVFAGMFGLGVVLFVAFPSGLHLNHILFGDMLGIRRADFVQAVIIGILTTVVLLVLRRDLELLTFDEQHARAIGIATGFLNTALLAAISILVVAALQAVGIILAIAFLITPGATAFLLVRRFSAMLIVSTTLAAISTLIGLWASYWLAASPAASIVLVMTAAFALAFLREQLAGSAIMRRQRHPLR
ncbi:metal ABC transporter permease [Notoacmeibacter sp. MSK16QG-6]|uniref:metal ABC transporter permease n=1 Tax=Notoacmeibacter sp. MSK16QG-6 TaxID=2957982 RepID=UPI00209F98F8|nr:metal ABC transporter permease [Notoacmeibacter sp. MSK16QG-6]MCP1200036.1 metal ABC transporter permease [Notoacmeibacter sp. MSK16QG-6]